MPFFAEKPLDIIGKSHIFLDFTHLSQYNDNAVLWVRMPMLRYSASATPKFTKREGLRAMTTQFFADIHTHLLPATDDGAQDAETALAMVRMAYEEGTRAMILTPHYREQYRRNTPAALRERFDAFRQAVNEILPDLKLYLGSEVQYQMDVFQLLQNGEVLSLCDSRYVLLEFRGNALRSRVVAGVAEARQFGYVPIIAHAELCEVIRKDPTLRAEIAAMGARLQINADSVVGKRGLATKWFCGKLLHNQQVSFVASDAHDAQFRTPQLKEAYQLVQRRYGEEYAGRIFDQNARAVMENRLF